MLPRIHSLLGHIGMLGILVGVLLLVFSPAFKSKMIQVPPTTPAQTAAVHTPFTVATSSGFPIIVSMSTTVATSSSPTSKIAKAPILKARKIAAHKSTTTTASTTEVTRIQHPYSFAPKSFEEINRATRGALVNILCMPRGGGSLHPISGSGVIIDPRGVILTNAHVAQYVLLSEEPTIDLSCQIRTGGPATAQWTANVLYIPTLWVDAHVQELNSSRPIGTGEHDYALLRITGALSNNVNILTFPALPIDIRDAVGFLNDKVLGAGYPAEFIGGMAAENNLYPVSSVSSINQLLTFGTSTVDVLSLGGVIEAQGGSSGGPVVNAWGRVVGVISTTSDAPTTAARDLHAITLSYISRDLFLQTGMDLETFLAGDLASKEAKFNSDMLPGFIKQYLKALAH